MTNQTAIRLTVSDAAELLGVTSEAIRQRISRNTIRHTKIGTTKYVELDPEQINQIRQNRDRKKQNTDLTALVESLQDQITYLRGQLDQSNEANREMRRLVAALTQRIPELPERTDSNLPEQTANTINVEQQEQPERESFWQRLFGG